MAEVWRGICKQEEPVYLYVCALISRVPSESRSLPGSSQCSPKVSSQQEASVTVDVGVATRIPQSISEGEMNKWLKDIRLHKYANTLKKYSFQEVSNPHIWEV